MECIKISNQRSNFYFPVKGVTSYQLYDLWIKLSRKGYYKIFDKSVIVDPVKAGGTYFESLKVFIKEKGLK